MDRVAKAVLKRWYGMLGLPRRPSSWYRQGLQEELEELQEATTFWHRLSETSDVYFVITRALYDGHPLGELPSFASSRNCLIYAYMMAKLTSRWAFYRTGAILSGAPRANLVREVVNPSKDSKLDVVASRHALIQRSSRRSAVSCAECGRFFRSDACYQQ